MLFSCLIAYFNYDNNGTRTTFLRAHGNNLHGHRYAYACADDYADCGLRVKGFLALDGRLSYLLLTVHNLDLTLYILNHKNNASVILSEVF